MTSTNDTPAGSAAVMAVRDITKTYGHIEALRGVSLEIHAGEVLGIVGDNGAGKSTLIKTLSGTVTPTTGETLVGGKVAEIRSVADAQALGIYTVYQDLAQAPDLSAMENVFLGREPLRGGLARRLGVLARNEMRRRTEGALGELGVRVPSVTAPVRDLSGGQQQAVAIARAVMFARTAVIFDEPTAALGTRQTRIVYDTIRATAARGLAIAVVSHDIPGIVELADRIAVMRHGRVVAIQHGATSVDQVVHQMLGSGGAR